MSNKSKVSYVSNKTKYLLALFCVPVFTFLSISSTWARGRNVVAAVTASAKKYESFGLKTSWQTLATYESADFIEYIDKKRILVGTVASGSKLGIPRHGPVILYDARTGRELWSAKRSSLPGGNYRLLATKPLIVLASYHKVLEVKALAPGSGKQLGSFRASQTSVVEVDGDRLICLDPEKALLQSVDLRSGRLLWKKTLNANSFVGKTTGQVILADKMAFVISNGVEAFSLSAGKSQWRVKHPSFAKTTAAVILEKAIVFWSAEQSLRIDTSKGKIVWQRAKVQGGLKAVYAVGGLLVRVLAGDGGTAGDIVEALESSTGKFLWTRQLGDKIVSPVVHSDGKLIFTTNKYIVALRKTNGKKLFSAAFPERFAKNTPSVAPVLGPPDMLVIRKGKVVVWRDRAGIMALDLKSGKNLWTHYPLRPIPDYNVNDATLLKFTVRGIKAQQLRPGVVMPLHKPGPNPFLIAAERRHAEVMADKRSDSLDKRISSGAVMNQQRIASAFNQAQAAVDMGVGMIAAAQAIRKMNQMRAQEGLKQRFIMQADAIMRRRGRAFQGSYFIEPFLARGVGMGVTLVNLDTGKRGDFLYSPLVIPLLDFSVDLLCYALDETETNLITVGLGLNTKKYKTMKKWRWRLPRPSLLALNISALPFSHENRFKAVTNVLAPATVLSPDEIQKIANAAVAAAMKTRAPGPVPGPALKALYAAVKANNVAGVTSALNKGADVNGGKQPEPPLTMALREKQYEIVNILLTRGANVRKAGGYKLTPLHFATLQFNLPLMKRLIGLRADVNAKNSLGLTPLLMMINNGYWFSYKEKMLPGIELLLKNGANTNLKTNLNISLLKHAKKQSRKLYNLIKRYEGR